MLGGIATSSVKRVPSDETAARRRTSRNWRLKGPADMCAPRTSASQPRPGIRERAPRQALSLHSGGLRRRATARTRERGGQTRIESATGRQEQTAGGQLDDRAPPASMEPRTAAALLRAPAGSAGMALAGSARRDGASSQGSRPRRLREGVPMPGVRRGVLDSRRSERHEYGAAVHVREVRSLGGNKRGQLLRVVLPPERGDRVAVGRPRLLEDGG